MADEYDSTKIKGDRKRKVTLDGAQMRAFQDAIEYLDGPAYFDERRRRQIADHMRRTVTAYRNRDRVVQIADGSVTE